MSDNMYMVLSEFVLEKTIYPHIYCRLGFHMNIEMRLHSTWLKILFARPGPIWEIFARTYHYKTVNMLHVACTPKS